MRNFILIILILVLAGAGALAVFSIASGWTPETIEPSPVACSLEAKVCPDGGSVGRVGLNCYFATCPSSPAVASTTPGDITLGVGKTGSVGGLSITFNALLQDNRCPVDVQCIEGGAVNTNVTFKSGMQTVTKNMPSDEVAQQFAGYHISIADVVPPAKSGVEIPSNAYKVTFHVSK